MNMSSDFLDAECPRCGKRVDRVSDRDPPLDAQCLECGFYHFSFSVEGVETLEEVNNLREALGLEPLTALKEPRDTAVSRPRQPEEGRAQQ